MLHDQFVGLWRNALTEALFDSFRIGSPKMHELDDVGAFVKVVLDHSDLQK